jgi:hypothetical protein
MKVIHKVEFCTRSWLALMSLSVYALKDISASQERLCHLLSKNYKSACAIC